MASSNTYNGYPQPSIGQIKTHSNGTAQIYTGNPSSGVGGWMTISPSNSTQPIMTPNVDGDVTLTAKGRTIKISELIDFIDDMKKRMLILEPNFEKHEQYPALKAAYEDYLLIERMVTGDQN